MSDHAPIKRMPAVGDWVYTNDGGRLPWEVIRVAEKAQKVHLSGRGWRHLSVLFCVSRSQLQGLRDQRDTLTRVIAWLREQKSG